MNTHSSYRGDISNGPRPGRTGRGRGGRANLPRSSGIFRPRPGHANGCACYERSWPVFESISTQTRHRRLSTRHKERQAAPNRLLSPSPPSQALSKRFSRAPGPLRVVHRSPTSTGQAPVLWARTAGRSAIIVSPRRRQNGRCFSESTDATGSPLNSLTNEKSLI